MDHFLLLVNTSLASISWTQIALRYMEYIGYFLVYGALGFRWLVARTRRGPSASDGEAAFFENALRSAARLGMAGALLLGIELFLTGHHKVTTTSGFFAIAGPKLLIQLAFAGLALLAFAAAFARFPGAWILASLAAIGFVFRNAASKNKWTAPVNPLHEAGGAIWLGTLLLIVLVGVPLIWRSQLPAIEERGLLARLIKRFSVIALSGAALMGVTGVITSWTHLKFFAALWTTSYGITLCLKLLVVFAVVILGAWNWRRIGPVLEAQPDSTSLRRLSIAELVFGAVVLLITAVLVLLPSPSLPKG
ncbi:MAG: CopD family protein [Acidobacteriaceae bacterium]|nr:CopD family protein [Acidobacteriaceae bacterium]